MTIQKTGRVYPVFYKYERNTIVRITAHRKIEITPKSLLFFFPLITNPPVSYGHVLAIFYQLAGQSVQKLGGAVMPPALGHFVPAGRGP